MKLRKWIQREVEWHLRKLKLYRKRKGGKWFHVKPHWIYGIPGSYWINRKPLYNEELIEKEVYFDEK